MKLIDLAEQIDARLAGDGQKTITAVASLQEAGPEDISFLSDARQAARMERTQAGAVLVAKDFQGPGRSSLLYVEDVEDALEKLLLLFAPAPDLPAEGIHPSAQVSAEAQLGEQVAVGPNVVVGAGVRIGSHSVLSAGCVIGRNVRMGSHCFLGPNVVVNWGCVLGDHVIIHGNSTIGTDGFGYRLVNGRHRKIPHIGIVVIEEDVEIGANACVDRAKFGRTWIGRGTKIDNLVQIAHNVQIGENCIIVSQTGIAGSTELGKYVVLAGQCGIVDHVKLGDGVMAGARSAIFQDFGDGVKVLGTPAHPMRDCLREISLIKKLPEMAKEIKTLREELKKYAGTKDNL
jgi:UDP-3-O-[3-hydroxymyristoyl] glucosamine N-acyltransferase